MWRLRTWLSCCLQICLVAVQMTPDSQAAFQQPVTHCVRWAAARALPEHVCRPPTRTCAGLVQPWQCAHAAQLGAQPGGCQAAVCQHDSGIRGRLTVAAACSSSRSHCLAACNVPCQAGACPLAAFTRAARLPCLPRKLDAMRPFCCISSDCQLYHPCCRWRASHPQAPLLGGAAALAHVRRAFARRLSITIPWTALTSQPIQARHAAGLCRRCKQWPRLGLERVRGLSIAVSQLCNLPPAAFALTMLTP